VRARTRPPPTRSSAAPPRLLRAQHIAYLEAREAELAARVDALTRELVTAAAGAGASQLPALLRGTTAELLALQADFRALQAQAEALRERALAAEGDVARASATIAKLRQELRDERKKRDKLLQNLEAQREVEVAAESMIQSLQQRVASCV